jgi:hypothetical protein
VSVTAEQPDMVVPFAVKATVPVGTGGPAGVTVAVNVTAVPAVDGFRLDVSAVAEAAVAACVTTLDVLPLL